MTKPIIGVGMIGLSTNAKVSWASMAHLPFLCNSNKFRITALLNTSLNSAKNARETYKLEIPDSSLYDSAELLANDRNVDLIVCNVRVDRHRALIEPALRNGKDVFVEWPLGVSLQEAELLASLAKEKKVIAICGNQARLDPLVDITQNFIKDRLGPIHSVSIQASAFFHGHQENVKVDYFTDRKVGGNILTIHLAHLLDYVTATLGPLNSDFDAQFSTAHPIVDLVNDSGEIVNKGVKKDVPDQIMIQGKLRNHSNALFSLFLRGGKNFKNDSDGLIWTIYGQNGELRITHSSSNLNVGTEYPITRARFHDFSDDSLTDIYEKDTIVDPFKDLPLPARNIARIYDSYALGKAAVSFEDAVKLHHLIKDVTDKAERGTE